MSISQDQERFIIGILVSVPLSFAIRKLAKAQHRYLFSFILGTALQLYVYGTDIWMPFAVHLMIYGIIKIKGRNSGALVTGISIFALSVYHIYRTIVDYGSWILDISTILMSMVCKYSLFAYAYQDGGKQKQKLTAGQQVYKLVELPSLYHYLVYCQFLPTSVIGTALEFKDFQNFMQLKAPFDNIPTGKILKKISFEFGQSLICGALYFTGVLLFPLAGMQDYSFAQQSPLYIVYYSFFCVSLLRFKYYFGWKLSQCAVHASGVSYDQNQQFERVKTCDPWIIQTTLHVRQKVAHWNMSCQLWLRRCIYQRAPFKNKNISQAYVFVISSFWHGFYGGYYLSFLFWFLQINLAIKVFKFVKSNQKHPLVLLYNSTGILGYAFLWFTVNLLFSHNGLYFQILDSSLGFLILQRIYFIPPLLIIFGLFYFSSSSNGNKPSRSSKKQGQQILPTPVKQD